MHVTYSPADGTPETWVFKPALVKAGMAEVIENRAGVRFESWVDEVLAGSVKARRVLLWHLTCVTHPHTKFEDTPDFAFGELKVDRDLDELIEWRKVIESFKGSEDVRTQGLAEVDDLIDAERARGGVEAGKAISPNGDSPTPSPSQPSSV